MSPWKIGFRPGASAQSHSMIRSKKLRIIRRRCRWVFLAMVVPADTGLAGEPNFVVLDVGPADGGDGGDVAGGDQPTSELAQRYVGQVDASRSEKRGELREVSAHGAHQHRSLRSEVRPFTFGRRGPDERFGVGCGDGHELMASSASSSAVRSASMSCEARWYSPASQSLVKCR